MAFLQFLLDCCCPCRKYGLRLHIHAAAALRIVRGAFIVSRLHVEVSISDFVLAIIFRWFLVLHPCFRLRFSVCRVFLCSFGLCVSLFSFRGSISHLQPALLLLGDGCSLPEVPTRILSS